MELHVNSNLPNDQNYTSVVFYSDCPYQSMSLYDKLAKKPKLFIRCTGLTVSEFNLVAGRLAKKYPKAEQKRLSKRSRVRGIGARRRWKLDLKNRFLLVLFYYRTYATQDLLAMVFQVGQASVSRSMGGRGRAFRGPASARALHAAKANQFIARAAQPRHHGRL